MEKLQFVTPESDNTENEKTQKSPDRIAFNRNIFDALAKAALPDRDRDLDIRSDNNSFDSGWTTLSDGEKRWDVEVVD